MQETTVRAAIVIRKPRAEVFDTVTDAQQMSRYWFTRSDAGLAQGEPCRWYVGTGADAPAVDIQVKVLRRPEALVFDWSNGGNTRTVSWTFDDRGGDTVLTVEERGFAGPDDTVVAQALDSTGGFNQVVVALKAWVEHGVAINVVGERA